MRILAALYIAGMLTWLGCWALRKADKFFWQGIFHGGLIAVGYILFIVAVMELAQPMVWR